MSVTSLFIGKIPHSVLAGALLLLPVTYFLGEDGKVSFFPSYLLSICVILLGLTDHAKNVLKDNRQAITALTIFLGYMTLTSLNGEQPLSSVGLYAGYSTLIFTFVLAVPLSTRYWPRFYELFLLTTILSGVVSSLYSIYLFYALDYQPLVENRLYSIGALHNPVVSAISYGACASLCLGHLVSGADRMSRLLAASALAILCWAMILCGTRSIWIGFIAAAASLVLIVPGLNLRQRTGVVLAGVFAIIILGVVIWILGYHEELLRRSTSFRPEIWQGTLDQVVSQAILFGHGLQTTPLVIVGDLSFDHAHSIYISTLYYGGLIGLVMFLLMLGFNLYSQREPGRTQPRYYMIPCLIFGTVTLLFDGDRIIDKVDYIWLAIWLPLAMGLVKRSDAGEIAVHAQISTTTQTVPLSPSPHVSS